MPDDLELLRRLGRELADPDDENVARARELLERRIRRASADTAAARASGRRPRWALAAAASVALLVGSGLGFGLGSSLGGSESASASVLGFGFIPAQGWNVVQTGTLDETGVARAIAANVALDPRDGLGGRPVATLETLPRRGVLIYATFSPRGDPARDFEFPVRDAPLTLDDAERLGVEAEPAIPRRLGRFRLAAAVGGYNVDARIYFGDTEPSHAARAGGQQQLNRLVVAAESVTISGRPTVAGTSETVWLFGTVDNRRAGEVVDVQAKDCGQQFYRGLTGATTTEGGAWRVNFFPIINTSLRAVWKGNASAPITIRRRAGVGLRQSQWARRTFLVSATGANSGSPFYRKYVLIQRFDRRLGRWTTVKRVVLTTTSGWGTRFTASFPRGTQLRAFLPLSQARPCWVEATSPTVTVR